MAPCKKKVIMFHGTTVVALIHNGKLAMAGDGQVSFQDTVMKHHAKKIRKLLDDRILVGFAGATADAFTLFERFEVKLKDYSGNLVRAAVELAKDWRTDRVLRRLEALLLVADKDKMLLLSGNGDIIEPDDQVVAIGSGGQYALAAVKAMLKYAGHLSAKEIVTEALMIAADICIYTNQNIVVEEL